MVDFKAMRKDMERLLELRLLSTAVGSPSMTGMPGGHGVTSKVEKYSVEIVDLEAKIARQYTTFFDSIADDRTREIFILRCIGGLKWKEVASRIGGNATAYSVRQVYSRYIKGVKAGTEGEKNT